MEQPSGDRIPIRRALLSVADKTGLTDFARTLTDAGVAIVASEGTAATLEHDGVPCTTIGEVTGAPELLGGRVKTLHPVVHAGILADPGRPGHTKDLRRLGIERFDLVVVVPYRLPGDSGWDDIVEHVDIGGPAMIRGAAKNHAHVAVVVSPDQYDDVIEAVRAGGTDGTLRRRLARRAFFTTASLDAAVLGHLDAEPFPERLIVPLERRLDLRYGENPDQSAAAYATPDGAWWTRAMIRGGGALSATNLADASAARGLAVALRSPAAVVVKHTNPCGAAEADHLPGAFAAAWDGDSRAAYGGVVAVNAPLDAVTAAAIAEQFVEVIVAPALAPGAAAALSARPRIRVIEAPFGPGDELVVRGIDGGVVLQDAPPARDGSQWRVVAGPVPDPEVLDDLRMAWQVAAHSHSNAVAIIRRRAAVGVGAGDQARVGAAERAVERAGDRASGAVAASDGFFPFSDGLDVLIDAGVRAVVEPGGSRRDAEVIAAADERGITLMFTGTRRFRH